MLASTLRRTERELARRAATATTTSKALLLPNAASSRESGYSTLTSILDGSVWQLNSRKGRLVGTDQHGNEYYENTKYQQGRSRWVKYKDLNDYNPANVPREWHQWLHYISDEPDLTQEIKYEIPAIQMKLSKPFGAVASNEPRYYPKGHFFNKKGIKDWKKYGAWSPP